MHFEKISDFGVFEDKPTVQCAMVQCAMVCIMGELVGGGSLAGAVAVSDM